MNAPKIYWLVSYPKSGNTWCRAFLSNYMNKGENYIGINQLEYIPMVSSHFFVDTLLGLESSELTNDEIDEFRLESFKILQKKSNNIQIMKVHDCYEPDFFTDDITAGVIYIVRNPLDVAVSFAYHLNTSIECSIQHLNDEHSYLCNNPDKFEIQFPQKISSWRSHVNSWMRNFKGNLLLLRYEDLLDYPQKTFADLINFLPWEYNEEIFHRSLKISSFNSLKQQEEQEGFKEKSPKTKTFFREGKSGTWRKYLRDDQIAEIIKHHGEVMKDLKYLDKNGDVLI